MTKATILKTIKQKAYSNYFLWFVGKDIKHYDQCLLYLDLYCELTGKSMLEEKHKMWKDYERTDKKTITS